MTRISKDFSFDAAHILALPYVSKCNRLHGHTYKVTMEFEGPTDSNGMTLDYNKFPKDLVEEMDHKFLVSGDQDYDEMSGFWNIKVGDVNLSLPHDQVYHMPTSPNTTAEEIAKHFYNKLVGSGFSTLKSVTVSETPSTRAVYPE